MERKIIEETLLKIGMAPGLNGFAYITDAILLLAQPEWSNPKWTALYHCVGNMHSVSGDIVESSIRHAFKITRTRGNDYKSIEHYIGFTNCENSSSLMLLYTRLKYETKKINTQVTKLMLKETLLELLSV